MNAAWLLEIAGIMVDLELFWPFPQRYTITANHPPEKLHLDLKSKKTSNVKRVHTTSIITTKDRENESEPGSNAFYDNLRNKSIILYTWPQEFVTKTAWWPLMTCRALENAHDEHENPNSKRPPYVHQQVPENTESGGGGSKNLQQQSQLNIAGGGGLQAQKQISTWESILIHLGLSTPVSVPGRNASMMIPFDDIPGYSEPEPTRRAVSIMGQGNVAVVKSSAYLNDIGVSVQKKATSVIAQKNATMMVDAGVGIAQQQLKSVSQMANQQVQKSILAHSDPHEKLPKKSGVIGIDTGPVDSSSPYSNSEENAEKSKQSAAVFGVLKSGSKNSISVKPVEKNIGGGGVKESTGSVVFGLSQQRKSLQTDSLRAGQTTFSPHLNRIDAQKPTPLASAIIAETGIRRPSVWTKILSSAPTLPSNKVIDDNHTLSPQNQVQLDFIVESIKNIEVFVRQEAKFNRDRIKRMEDLVEFEIVAGRGQREDLTKLVADMKIVVQEIHQKQVFGGNQRFE
ncbi:hypothetical protein HK100_010316 [Physocladia obscura]|uniref:Uncharacterized protein n=1 Tax=Physocladia obscura TaxID=109957 RepID=A0AAD5T570_9FUNG|nr:hypothetical protein HK100_010316 [Physocladia obscura]